MFSKRLSIALCATMCFGTLLFGNNPESSVNTKPVEEENSWMAPEAIPDFYLTYTAPKCNGNSDGSIIVNITTGIGPFKIEYKSVTVGSFITEENGATDFTIPINGLSAGFYDVKVTDLGQTPSISNTETDFELEEFSVLTLTPSIDPIDCSTETGKITLIASGGDGSYNYTLSLSGSPISPDGGGGNVFSGLAEGSYIAKVIDGNGCPETKSSGLNINIPEPISPFVTEGTIDCPGGTTTIELTNLPSDASSYQIKLNGNSPSVNISGTTAIISNVPADSYNLSIERPGCSSDNWSYSGNPFTIEDYAPVGFDWVDDPNSMSINCFGDVATATVTITGGQTGKTVKLSLRNNVTGIQTVLNSNLGFNVSYDIPNLEANTSYTLIVEDSDGACGILHSYSFSISGPTDAFRITGFTKTDVSCNGSSDGEIKINHVYSGGGSIEYSVDNGASFPGTLSTDNKITGLSKGSYNVVLKNKNGCISNDTLVVINEPNPIGVTLSVLEDIQCPNGTGKLQAVTVGGATPRYYTLKDSNGNVVSFYNEYEAQDTLRFPNLPSGDYTVEVKGGTCIALGTDTEILRTIPDVAITITHDPVLCRDEPINNFHVSATGGDGSKFSFTLKDENGIVLPSVTELAPGDGYTFNGLNPGKPYKVEASYGSCGVVAYEDTLIGKPPVFNVIYPDTVNLQCYGGDTTVTISASGKKPFEISTDGITYNTFSSNDEKHVLTGLSGGNYSYYLRDGNECLFNDGNPILINVIEPTQINVNVLTTNPKVKCFGEADAVVELEITGGEAPFWVTIIGNESYKKSTDNDGFVTFLLPAEDNYDVYIEEDGNRCSVTRSGVFSVQEPAQALSFTTIVDEPMLKCYGDSTLVTVDNISGGWPGTYSINILGGNGINKDLPVGENSIYLKKGTYTITVTDNINGCEATEEIEIEQPPLFKIVGYITHEDVSCNGASDASITFEVAGGTQPYYWGIDDVPTVEFTTDNYTITNSDYELSADTYTLYLADANGCPIEGEEVEIEEPDPVEFEITKVDSVVCSGEENGRIVVAATGGNESFIYSLSGEMTRAGQASNEFKNLRAGNYTVHVEDTNGCNAEDKTAPVFEPRSIEFDYDPEITKQITCAGETDAEITVYASGGEPYSLEYMVKGTNMSTSYGENHVIGNLDDGSYSVYVRDNRGKCETKWTALVEVIDPEPLVLLEPEITQVSCHNMQDGEVKLVADGGQGVTRFYLYKVTPTDTSLIAGPKPIGEFSDLGEQSDRESISTRYLVVVNDENDCEAQRFFNIINPPKLEISGWEKFDALCHNDRNGSIDLTIVGGTIESDYTITDLLSPGLTYNVEKITDNNYVINGLGSSDPAGTKYRPVVTDDNGCEVMIESPVLIGNPEQVEYEVTIESALCHGDIDDKIIIHATGGTGTFYYSLDGGNTYGALGESSFVNEPEGLKKPYVKDENGCVSPNVWPEFLYEEPKPLEVRFTKQGIMCWEDEFGNVVLDIEGGTGDYFLSVKDDNFEATPYFSNPYTITRAREDITTYDLYNDGNIELPEREEFYLFLKDENGCRVQSINDDNEGVISIHKPVFSTTFERPDPLVLLEDPMPYPVTCAGDRTGRIGFKVEGGNFPNFVFTATKQQDPHQGSGQEFNGAVNSSGRGEIEKLYSGIYRCVVTDQHGCQAHTPDMVEIDYVDVEIDAEFDSISVVIYDTIQPVCDSKSNGELHINVLNYMDMGVDVRLEKFNQGSKIFQIHKDDTITYTAEDGDIIFNPEVDFSTYEVHQQLLAERLGIGLYQVIAQDRRSTCTDTVVFNLSSEFGVDCPMVSYYNWFSPHSGNQENDEWEIIETEYEDYLLQIYTSYGELVYSDKGNSDVENIKWDGLDDNGMPAPVGTYIYILQKSNGVRDTIINGNVSIIRNVYK